MKTWLPLAESAAFKALFEDKDSPVVAEIERLERRVHGLAVTDPVESMKDRASLWGLQRVREAVLAAARAEAEDAQSFEPARRRASANTALPWRVAG